MSLFTAHDCTFARFDVLLYFLLLLLVVYVCSFSSSQQNNTSQPREVNKQYLWILNIRMTHYFIVIIAFVSFHRAICFYFVFVFSNYLASEYETRRFRTQKWLERWHETLKKVVIYKNGLNLVDLRVCDEKAD